MLFHSYQQLAKVIVTLMCQFLLVAPGSVQGIERAYEALGLPYNARNGDPRLQQFGKEPGGIVSFPLSLILRQYSQWVDAHFLQCLTYPSTVLSHVEFFSY